MVTCRQVVLNVPWTTVGNALQNVATGGARVLQKIKPQNSPCPLNGRLNTMTSMKTSLSLPSSRFLTHQLHHPVRPTVQAVNCLEMSALTFHSFEPLKSFNL